MPRTASTDHANDPININGVAPGLAATRMARDNFENPEILTILQKVTPLPRSGETKDITNAAHFLVSPASS
ncbi:hypothetical protein BKA63DRAFT_525882 [Paraphoma chrysanthemicola]|nr:hypothetical protein BKA63DRAFT_525882 [Paraphoma chrysanthemicola]